MPLCDRSNHAPQRRELPRQLAQKRKEFTRTMQAYKSIIAENTTLVLSTDSDLFKFLTDITPKGGVVPAQRSGDTR